VVCFIRYARGDECQMITIRRYHYDVATILQRDATPCFDYLLFRDIDLISPYAAIVMPMLRMMPPGHYFLYADDSDITPLIFHFRRCR